MRRGAIGNGIAAAGVAGIHVRGAHAAGKLSIGLWDPWGPGANDAMMASCNEWAAKEKVDFPVDFITTIGAKHHLTVAAEAQARSGHDMLVFIGWNGSDPARLLEPVDDLMADLVKTNGAANQAAEYLGKVGGKRVAVPWAVMSAMKPPRSRIDLLTQDAGIDIVAMYPADAPPRAGSRTRDALLGAAGKCFEAGFPFGLPLGQFGDAVDWVDALFQGFGAQLAKSNADIVFKSDGVKQVLGYSKRLVRWLPAYVFPWDDASDNRWLVSGRGTLIMSPPSGWAVAVRDTPHIAERCWTHGMPAGPKGDTRRLRPSSPASGPSRRTSRRRRDCRAISACRARWRNWSRRARDTTRSSRAKLTTFKTWVGVGPPKATLYHYPNPYNHQIAVAPAPPKIASQTYAQATMPKIIARVASQAESIDTCLDWAQKELQGYKWS